MFELIFWIAVAAIALFVARQVEAHERRRAIDVILVPPPPAPAPAPAIPKPAAPPAVIVPPAPPAPAP